MTIRIETEYLIVGAGPAGAALACFLGQNGMAQKYLKLEILFDNKYIGAKGIVISKTSGSADTPRAHLVNPFATGMVQTPQHGTRPANDLQKNVCVISVLTMKLDVWQSLGMSSGQ
jgi:FAD binding domain